MRTLLVTAALSLCIVPGCVAVTQNLNPNKTYRHSLFMRIGGMNYVGTAILHPDKKIKIHAESQDDMDYLVIRTAHREVTTEDNDEKVDFVYEAQPGLEDDSPIDISGFNKNGKHSFGYIVFDTPTRTLPGTIRCNGLAAYYVGTSLCHAAAGLIEEISFGEPVKVSQDSRVQCSKGSLIDDHTFRIAISPGKCVYSFKGNSGYHVMHILGYDETILLKE